jgi:general secretion pathway protein A
MYTTYFGLAEKPFSITPDPRFLYLSEQHAEALAHLQYGILEGGGFIQLTGEVGTGKTTLTRSLLARLPEEIDLALLLNPRVSVRELLVTICEELGLTDCADAPDNKTLIDRLNARLLEGHARGHRAVLVIDEAQNLEVDVLEQLRLLTNLETDSAKLLQIILIGQPELRDTLARGDLRQLAQRITGRYHLGPLGLDDTLAYVRHRLAVAGVTREIFTQRALIEVHRVSAGTPRLINVICDRALLGAYTSEQATVSPKLVRDAAREICGHTPRGAPRLRTAIAGATVAAVALVLTLAFWLRDANDAAEPAADLQSATVEAVVPAATAAAGTQASQQPVSPPATQASSAGAPASLPASASLEDWLRGEAGATGTDAAFSTLLGLWRVAPPEESAQPCRYAGEHGLHCEHQLGSWALLRSLNRPAILDLVDSRGDAHQVVLAALDDERATLQIGAQTRAFAPAEIDRCWFGEFLILWRPDARAADLMLPGSRSEGVRWLREKLATLQGGSDASRDPALYDDVLVERVRAFQRQQGLLADGKAGLRTLIALDTALGGADTPLLRNGG